MAFPFTSLSYGFLVLQAASEDHAIKLNHRNHAQFTTRWKKYNIPKDFNLFNMHPLLYYTGYFKSIVLWNMIRVEQHPKFMLSLLKPLPKLLKAFRKSKWLRQIDSVESKFVLNTRSLALAFVWASHLLFKILISYKLKARQCVPVVCLYARAVCHFCVGLIITMLLTANRKMYHRWI